MTPESIPGRLIPKELVVLVLPLELDENERKDEQRAARREAA